MSWHDYEESRHVSMDGYSFYGLLMAAMREADFENIAKLRSVFPEVWDELHQRYNSPGGVLPEERRDFSTKKGSVQFKCESCRDMIRLNIPGVCSMCGSRPHEEEVQP